MAVIYLVAFLVAANQFRPLLGSRGILPIPQFVRVVRFRQAPSVFHVHYSDRFFAGLAWTGVVIAALALTGIVDRAPTVVTMLAWATLWAIYLSIVNVGQTWYAFGWETLLLEAGIPDDLPRARRERPSDADPDPDSVAVVPGRVRGRDDQGAR